MLKRNKTNKKFCKDDDGVSPVVGVILMVAITVVMAAIVSSWSSSVKAPTSPTTVGLDISRSDKNITLVVTTIDPPSAAPIPTLNVTYQWYNGTFNTNSTDEYLTDADVGNMLTIETNSSTIKPFVVIARFKDGSKKVLYSRDT
ncbi:MAG: type IV pilin N-terminal domain-containing protein [Candidatus Methanoperedens sp.]